MNCATGAGNFTNSQSSIVNRQSSHSLYCLVDGKGNEDAEDEGKAHAPGDGDGGFGLGAEFFGFSQPEEEDTLNEGRDADGGHFVEASPVKRHGDGEQESIQTVGELCDFSQPHDDGRREHDAEEQGEPGHFAVSLFLSGDIHDAHHLA